MDATTPSVAPDKPVYRRATYYLRPEQIRALKLRAVTEDRDLSTLVREAIDGYPQTSRDGGRPAGPGPRRALGPRATGDLAGEPGRRS